MSNLTATSEHDDSDYARRLAQEEQGRVRQPEGPMRWLLFVVAVAWSIFHVAIAIPAPKHANWVIVDAVVVRCVHLGFALLLAFLSYPLLRYPRFGLAWLSRRDRVPTLDLVLGVVGAVVAVVYVIDFEGVGQRAGQPSTRDIVVGVTLVIVLLEAARRVVGPALAVVAGTFVVYSFAAPYMPAVIAYKGNSLDRFVTQMTMSTDGIYGIPLDVSASVVFLFVLFGSLLNRAGGGRFFIDLALCVLGTYRGGPAKAAVVGSGLTGIVSGSSIANIVTTGTFTIPLMKQVGYPAKKAASIEVAASTDGQLAPPVMGAAAFIIAETVGVPYLTVVTAAAIPAFASYVALFYITHLEACKLGLRGIPRAQLPELWQVLRGGWHFFVPLGVLLYELIIARHSPELAAFHAVWVMAALMLVLTPLRTHRRAAPVIAFVAAVVTAGGLLIWWGGLALSVVLPIVAIVVFAVVHRAERHFSGLRGALRVGIGEVLAACADAARNMIAVALATAAAGIIVGIVTMGFGGLVTQIVATLSGGNIYAMLLITALASLLLGMGLPTTATYVVMASLIAPVIVSVGAASGFVVPVLAAHLFVFYFGILADDTPPVGLAAYAAAAIAKSDPIPTGLQAFMYDIRTAILPFMFIFNTDLILHGFDLRESWSLALFVFGAACLANCAFAAATQGWFVTRNRWYDVVLLLLATIVLFRPELAAAVCGVPGQQRYWMVGAGALIMAGVYGVQRLRASRA